MHVNSLENQLDTLDLLGEVLRKGRHPSCLRAGADPLKLAEHVLVLPTDNKPTTDKWRVPIEPDDWSDIKVIERCFGVTPHMLKQAIVFGVLRPNIHFRLVSKKKKWGKAKVQIQYNGKSLLHMIPEIRLASRMTFSAWFRQVTKLGKNAKVSSEMKAKLSVGIRESTILIQQLQRRLEDLLRIRLDLEYKYRETLWETKDCPYCKGTSTFNGKPCIMCGPTVQNEDAVPLVSCSALDDLPERTLCKLRTEAEDALNRGDDEGIRWIVDAYTQAVNRRRRVYHKSKDLP